MPLSGNPMKLRHESIKTASLSKYLVNVVGTSVLKPCLSEIELQVDRCAQVMTLLSSKHLNIPYVLQLQLYSHCADKCCLCNLVYDLGKVLYA